MSSSSVKLRNDVEASVKLSHLRSRLAWNWAWMIPGRTEGNPLMNRNWSSGENAPQPSNESVFWPVLWCRMSTFAKSEGR
jgi:hypothetical protein